MDLDPDVLDEVFRSTDRGGSEYITFEDAKVGKDEVFYIGVKSEDQMAAEFGLVGLSSSTPFGGFNNDGNLNMMPLPGIIPDGSAADPAGVSIFGIYMAIHRTMCKALQLQVKYISRNRRFMGAVKSLSKCCGFE